MSKINDNQDISIQNDLGRKKVTIRVEKDGDSTVELETGVWNYGAIVSALVRAKYSADDIEAITNNNIRNASFVCSNRLEVITFRNGR